MAKMNATPKLNTSRTAMAATAKTIDGLAELTFAELPTTGKRPRLNLAIAIDASGSMGCTMGNDTALGHAKNAAMSLVARLNDDDRIAIVSYDSNVRVLIESMPAREAKLRIEQAMAHLHIGGCTALHAGWLAAAAQAAPHAPEYDLSRILLLSDGQATDGIRDPDALASEAAKVCEAGLSTSTYGLGMNFNEVLMTGMAVGGTARYAETAATLTPYFESDFAMLAQTVARSVHLKLTAKKHDQKKQVALDVKLLGGGKQDADGKWRLAPGIAGASSWAAFEINAEDTKNIAILAEWTVVDLAGKSHVIKDSIEVARGRGKDVAEVIARVGEARAAASAAAAAEAARRGDFEGTRMHLSNLRGFAGGSAYATSVSKHLDALEMSGNLGALAKETMYASTTMNTRNVDIGEVHSNFTSQDRFGLRKAVQGEATPDKKEAKEETVK